MKNKFLHSLFSYQCPRFPYQIVQIYQNALLVLASIAGVAQIVLVILGGLKVSTYGPPYRIFESIGIFSICLASWVFSRKNKQKAYIFTCIVGISMLIIYFELIIAFNEPEEGLLFISIFEVTSLVMLDFFKYYWVMMLYHITIIIYAYTRVLYRTPSSTIFTIYDCTYYIILSTAINGTLFYIFTTAFNIINNEKIKVLDVLKSWKEMMKITPIGIVIESKKKILFYNESAKNILSAQKDEVTYDMISAYLITNDEDKQDKIIQAANKYIYCDKKIIKFEEKDAQLIILNDISQVMEMQKQKHEQEMIEMLVSTSTHEMRTPLHCIKNTLEMLLEENNKNDEFISRAIIACDMQEGYINDMLDFAKMKKNSLSILQEVISANDLVQEVSNYFVFTTAESHISLTVDSPPNTVRINADYNRLKQVLFNLISNSFKFTFKGGITLKVQKINTSALIQVIDTGIGIKIKDIGDLFKPFGVIESTRNINKSGTGLGLFLSKKLCNLMGADISVESCVNIGTTFTITFPLVIDESIILSKRPSLKKNPHITTNTSAMTPKSKGKVLIVDDNGFNCRILEKMLESLNIGSYKAFNGQIALDIINKCSDILAAFIDLNMPVMNGFQLIEKINKSAFTGNSVGHLKFPIFALTGDTSDNIQNKCKLYGFTGFILKPFTKDLLIEILKSHSIYK